jgi:hypothetical protein
MTPAQQQKAIAEACGWDTDPEEAQGWCSRGQWVRRGKGLLISSNYLPDYLHDLNTTHEMEKVLEEKGVATVLYMDTLHKLVGYHSYDVAHATAAQRSEAFLRTIGKWVEL